MFIYSPCEAFTNGYFINHPTSMLVTDEQLTEHIQEPAPWTDLGTIEYAE